MTDEVEQRVRSNFPYLLLEQQICDLEVVHALDIFQLDFLWRDHFFINAVN